MIIFRIITDMIIISAPQIKIMLLISNNLLFEFDFGLIRTHQQKNTVYRYHRNFSKAICIVSQHTCAKLLDCSSNIFLWDMLQRNFYIILSPVKSNFGLSRTHQQKNTADYINILKKACQILEVLLRKIWARSKPPTHEKTYHI